MMAENPTGAVVGNMTHKSNQKAQVKDEVSSTTAIERTSTIKPVQDRSRQQERIEEERKQKMT